MKSKSTPDERFLIKIYETAMENGENPMAPVNFQKVAKSLGQKETATKNMIKHLAQANFLKKIDEMSLRLTQRGCQFVEDALST